MKDWYLLLNGDIIVDAIEYPVDGYTHVQLEETHLPAGINAGYYRWNGTAYSVDEALKSQIVKQPLEQQVTDLKSAQADIIFAMVSKDLM